MLGGSRAKRSPDAEHAFGYGRERYFWAFVVALVLFSLGSAFSIFEGIEKIRHPHEVESPVWAFSVLGVAVVLETFSFRTAIHESKPLKGDAGWWQFIRHSRIPELPVVLLEDLGALLGLLFALVAVSLTVATGDTIWDALGTLMIGFLLGVIAVILAWEMKSLLIGEAATDQKQRSIQDAINGQPGVRRLIHMRTEHIGPEELLVGAKVEFDPDLSMSELAGAVNHVEAAVRAAVPEARIMYIEPDIAGANAPATPTPAPAAH
jgi:cation diffusion facilitator family transporter